MMKRINSRLLITSFILFILIIQGCKTDEDPIEPTKPTNSAPTPYTLKLPLLFSQLTPPKIPKDNPMTVEGVALGKRIFYEKKLSVNNSISCSSCHQPQFSFSDFGMALSQGAMGQNGVRNAMPLFNLVYSDKFDWPGLANSIEHQALGPVTNPLEMMETWKNVAIKLKADPSYVNDFQKAYPNQEIDSTLITKAVAQFVRTLISGNSRMDNYAALLIGAPVNGPTLNAQEIRGYQVFNDIDKGDCTHCHGNIYNPLWTDFGFRNDGLDLHPDSGLALVTKKASDIGKFKTPSLRNLVFTAPYMHDGRFSTLEEVVDFYSDDVVVNSPNISPLMSTRQGGNANAHFTPQEKADLVAFLKSLSDSSFVNNPDYRP